MSANFPEYWKAVVDTMMDGVVVVDREGTILSVNRALERMIGYSAAELVGQECVILDCNTCFPPTTSGDRKKRCGLLRAGKVVQHRCQLAQERRATGTCAEERCGPQGRLRERS